MVKKSFLKKTEKTSYFPKKRINFSRILYGFFSLVFIGVTVYILFFSGFLNILNREFSPTEKIDSRKLSDRLDILLGEKYWSIVPKNNLLLLRESYVNNLFTREFGMVKGVKIAKKFPDKIKIEVEERKPAIILENSQGKFILDSAGNVYPSNFFDSSGFDSAELPILKETSAERAFSFENNSGSDYLDFIFKVKDKLEKLLDIPVEKTMTVSKIISGDVFFTTKEGWQIYFNKNIAIDKEMELLQIVLEKEIGKEQRPDLEYVDLRISNKILYRFKKTQPENISAEKSENESKDKKKN